MDEKQKHVDRESPLYPPTNFAMVDKGIYRSGYPQSKNIPFLKKLGIRSIIYLCPEDYPEQLLNYYKEMGVELLCYGVQGNKEPFNDIPMKVFAKIIENALLSNEKKPLLIHCNKGKHRTGCLVGCYRKLNGWTLASIFAEYQQFAYPKPRFVDQQFIEMFDTSNLQKIIEKQKQEQLDASKNAQMKEEQLQAQIEAQIEATKSSKESNNNNNNNNNNTNINSSSNINEMNGNGNGNGNNVLS